MKSDTSEPDSHKLDNEVFNSFTIALNNLCKTLPILFTDSSDPFSSPRVCLIQLHIFNLAYLALISVCT